MSDRDDPDSGCDVAVLLAAAMSHEIVPVNLSGNDRRKRPIKVVNKSGEVVRVEAHGKVLDDLARKAAIQTAVRDGDRPKTFICKDCGLLADVKPGPIHPRCTKCTAKARLVRQRERYAAQSDEERAARLEKTKKWSTANPEKRKEMSRKYREAHLESRRAKDREAALSKYLADPAKALSDRRQRRAAGPPTDEAKAKRKNEYCRARRARLKAEREGAS